MANLTLAVDETLVEKARAAAREQGTSLNALIRDYIEQLAGQPGGLAIYRQLEELWGDGEGHSGGQPLGREDAYEGRLG